MAIITQQYDQGDAALITDSIVDSRTKAPITSAPSTVNFVVLKPDGTTFIRYTWPGPSITQVTVDQYQVSFPLDQGGDWYGRFYVPAGGGGAVAYGMHTALFRLIVAPVTLV